MKRKIQVRIDKATWPKAGKPQFPTTFHSGEKPCDIDISAMLLLVGHLTTPTVTAGVSLSELWACVRYYFAVSPSSNLRLTSAFSNLDSHQKTILSDDFGMGIPIQYLIDPLKLAAWCDGREFASRFAALTLAPPPKLNKRGPGKSPDFVFRDQTGLYHVVECKGTQSGTAARDRQLSHTTKANQPSGAIIQKTMIKLKSHLAGQSLACGVAIGREGKGADSHLVIRDPEGELVVEIKQGQEAYAEDAVVRATAARALRAAGLPVSAHAMAAPSGHLPGARSLGRGKKETVRASFVEERLSRSRSELAASLEAGASSKARSRELIGRRSDIALPQPLDLDGQTYRSVTIQEGIPREFLRHMMEDGLRDGVVSEVMNWLPERVGRLKLSSDGGSAELRVGDFYRSTLRLNKSGE